MKIQNLPLVNINDCYNYSDVLRKLKLHINGTTTRACREYIKYNNLDISHFDKKRRKMQKYKFILKKCPVCSNEFETKNNRDEKTTCSHSCANTHFRSGENNPNWGNAGKAYRTICFKYHDKKCIVCGEENIVAVHHYNHDHDDNSPENLIPMCPTHHQYAHSKYNHLISNILDNYVENFKRTNNF